MHIVIKFLTTSKFYITSKNQRPVTSPSGKVGGARFMVITLSKCKKKLRGPAGRACTWLPYTMLKPPLVVNVSRDRKAAPGHEGCATSVVQCFVPVGADSARELPDQDSWTLGECTKKLAKRSYLVVINVRIILTQPTCVTCCQRVSSKT